MLVRAIAVDGDAVHHTPLAMVIVDRIVLDAAVVPKGDCGFTMNSAEQAAAWYHSRGRQWHLDRGLAQHAPWPAGQIYLAYIRDRDGNKLVGVYRPPA